MDWWVSWSNTTWLEEKYYGDYSKQFLFDVALAEIKLGLRGSKKIHEFRAVRTRENMSMSSSEYIGVLKDLFMAQDHWTWADLSSNNNSLPTLY